jgi:Flp pilus assembly protein TadD
VLRRIDPDGYADLSARWTVALAAHADDARVHANAAQFFTNNDDARALALLERAAELEPDEPEWSRRVARQVELMGRRDASPEARRERARHILQHNIV